MLSSRSRTYHWLIPKPVITDLPPDTISCSPRGLVGTYDREEVLANLCLKSPKEEVNRWIKRKWELGDSLT
ncbi:hypothetical protein Pmani_000761 [Petrolisthes manimaculis]|uniref:Uncharacterized protein n=1 Tax=Petrolisthes manimaculis TaxID=1843537 RepID=A0AAE1QLE1_9EUCA|nr:hypothetical protein Pmani_000761 [Petrolisthes manimaculis]